MTNQATLNDLTLQYLTQRARSDQLDWQRQKRRDDTGLVIVAALSLIGLGVLLGAALI